MPESDEYFMQLALAEAQKAVGKTSPNPCVGAVIVKDGKVLASGYHEKAGTPHAEIHALRKAGTDAIGATLYVTLEPCNHTGRTPPCSHAVAESGIRRVVIGMLDPNPLVDGGGRRYLIDKGIEVESGVLELECRRINRPFIKFITSGKPYVALKAGLSLDGRLNYLAGKSGWITGPQSVARVHTLRNEFDAILVGRRTVDIDNPALTTRLENDGRDPLRIILDAQLKLSPTARVFNLESNASTWVFCDKNCLTQNKNDLEASGAKVIGVESDARGYLKLSQMLDVLAKHGIISLLVEGGSTVHSSFLKEQLADAAYLFYAPLIAGSAGDSFTTDLEIDSRDDSIRLTDVTYTQLGEDILIEGDFCYPA